jgi:hypothetical protein
MAFFEYRDQETGATLSTREIRLRSSRSKVTSLADAEPQLVMMNL